MKKQVIFNAQTGETIIIDVPDTEVPIIVQPKTDIELLQEKNESLESQLAQTNSDFASFMDYYFTINPE